MKNGERIFMNVWKRKINKIDILIKIMK